MASETLKQINTLYVVLAAQIKRRGKSDHRAMIDAATGSSIAVGTTWTLTKEEREEIEAAAEGQFDFRFRSFTDWGMFK